MKTLASYMILPLLFLSGNLWAQGAAPERAGIYQVLKLGVDAGNGVITGYYNDGAGDDDSDNQPQYSCTFLLYGKKTGDKYTVQAWRPKDKGSPPITGELSFLPPKKENAKPSLRLQLSQFPGSCNNVDPSLTKPSGYHLGLEKSADWIEVRMVKTDKAPCYENPDPSASKKGSMIRGDVFEVLEKKPGWVRADFEAKPKGWVQETDLYATAPGN